MIKTMKKISNSSNMGKNSIGESFRSIFFRNELRALLGTRNSSVYLLSLIFLVAWFSLAYAVGGLEKLGERMNNPYTNWVDCQIPNGGAQKLSDIKDFFRDERVQNRYFLRDISDYCTELRRFQKINTSDSYYFRGRTIDFGDTLLYYILDPGKNNVVSRGYDVSAELPSCGIILKESMLSFLNYESPQKISLFPVKIDSGKILLPVIAVVKDLPNLCDYVISPGLYTSLTEPYYKTGFIQKRTGRLFDFLLSVDGADKIPAAKEIKDRLDELSISVDKIEPEVKMLDDVNVVTNLRVFLSNSLSSDSIELVTQYIIDNWKNDQGTISNAVDWECVPGLSLSSPYYAAFNFTRLDSVRPFKILMKKQFDVNISMDQIEDKENFALVSSLTFFVSVALFFLSILSVILFVNNKLRTHLFHNRANLGTFKAFGLSNRQLSSIYTLVIFAFLGLGLSIACIIVVVTNFVNYYFALSIMKFFDAKILLAFLVLFGICFLAVKRTIADILRETPGNLVYGR